MSGRIERISSHAHRQLDAGWRLCATPAGAIVDPSGLQNCQCSWTEAVTPSTVASALRAAGQWTLDGQPTRFDAQDWWYCTSFEVEPAAADEQLVLAFDGLATLAEVWLNDTMVLRSDNMFLAHELPLDTTKAGSNKLAIRFQSLDHYLKARRPRPRWRTPMVENQQLRWVRTTLLGRTPGWSPPAAAVGPWLPIRLERRRWLTLHDLNLTTCLQGDDGSVSVSARLEVFGSHNILSTRLTVSDGTTEHECELVHNKAANSLSGSLKVVRASKWWPHTHGAPITYDARILIEVDGIQEFIRVDLGRIGFRKLTVDKDGGAFAVSVNDVPVFCRGACWTPLDPVSLSTTRDSYEVSLRNVAGAGLNMLRISGTMTYESDAFLDLCDQYGILVWQDFMFANMDFPESDSAFAASVDAEARQQLARLQAHPCVAVLCGNSEGGQQAAMWGAPRELWNPPLFANTLRKLSNDFCPDVPYCPSSTHGGSFPHQVSQGVSSYYGVGAYLRPIADSQASAVRFATECLAFANIPEQASIDTLSVPRPLRVFHARWKERVPRDLGAGWDFDDVRDFYVKSLFNVDPMQLRYADYERYLELGRLASAEVMFHAFSLWRHPESRCRGALIWFLRDLWTGPGWGIIDSHGVPKAAYHFLKRAWQPAAIFLTDEGLNGLQLHAVNDHAIAIDAIIELSLYRSNGSVVDRRSMSTTIKPHGSKSIAATDLFDGFMDLSYSYRFGPPPFDVCVARLLGSDGGTLNEDCFHPRGLGACLEEDPELAFQIAAKTQTSRTIEITARRYVYALRVDAPHWTADAQYFSVVPGQTRKVTLHTTGHSNSLNGTLVAVGNRTHAHLRITD